MSPEAAGLHGSANCDKAAVVQTVNGQEASGIPLDPAAVFNLRSRPGYYNPSARVALLRRDRLAPHDELLIDFRQPEMRINLQAGGLELISGRWLAAASAGGESLVPAGEWDEVCWQTDADVDYLELDLALSGGWKLERQMALARKDRFLFLADALIGPPDARDTPVEIRYAASLPLTGTTTFAHPADSREGRLIADGKARATVLPLALPEWRAEFCHAALHAADGQLKLEQAAAGRNLYAPLFIDLDPQRVRRELTWRRLTVAEGMQIVPRDVAVGYRVEIGREQWLIYRSLAPRGNRTLLGHNTIYEFVCGRFSRKGKLQDIVSIE